MFLIADLIGLNVQFGASSSASSGPLYPRDGDGWQPTVVFCSNPSEVEEAVAVPAIDLYFLQDISKSFNSEFTSLKTHISEAFQTFHKLTVASWLGLGTFSDKPVAPLGSVGDHCFRHSYGGRDGDLSPLLSAVDRLQIEDGGDYLDSQLDGLLLAGEEFQNETNEIESLKLVALMTDSLFHVEGDNEKMIFSSAVIGDETCSTLDYPSISSLAQFYSKAGLVPLFFAHQEVANDYRELLNHLDVGGRVVPFNQRNGSSLPISLKMAVTDIVCRGTDVPPFPTLPPVSSSSTSTSSATATEDQPETKLSSSTSTSSATATEDQPETKLSSSSSTSSATATEDSSTRTLSSSSSVSTHHVTTITTISGDEGEVFCPDIGEYILAPQFELYFMQDVSASFHGALPNIKAQMASALSSIGATYRGSSYSLGTFVDKPSQPFGYGGDRCYERRVEMTSTTATIVDKMEHLETSMGGDDPESQLDALLNAAKDPYVGWSMQDVAIEEPSRPVHRVVVLITDAAYHTEGDSPLPKNVNGDLRCRSADYPSITTVASALQEKWILPLILATSEVEDQYVELNTGLGMPGVVGTLERDSSNFKEALLNTLLALSCKNQRNGLFNSESAEIRGVQEDSTESSVNTTAIVAVSTVGGVALLGGGVVVGSLLIKKPAPREFELTEDHTSSNIYRGDDLDGTFLPAKRYDTFFD